MANEGAVESVMPADKGLLNGACNRSACLARPATWFNSSTRAHYCPDCAFQINRWCPRGEKICTPVEAEEYEMNDSISHISNVNLSRCLRWHPEGIASWSLSDWAVAMAGEAGELCNVVKKLNRERDGLAGNKLSEEQLRAELRKEVADVYLYLDLLAQREGIDLAAAIRDKFNEVSERNGFPERL